MILTCIRTRSYSFDDPPSDSSPDFRSHNLLPFLPTKKLHASLDLSNDERGDEDGLKESREESSLHAE